MDIDDTIPSQCGYYPTDLIVFRKKNRHGIEIMTSRRVLVKPQTFYIRKADRPPYGTSINLRDTIPFFRWDHQIDERYVDLHSFIWDCCDTRCRLAELGVCDHRKMLIMEPPTKSSDHDWLYLGDDTNNSVFKPKVCVAIISKHLFYTKILIF